ncbi:MAG: WecB/TagA/CpsF family glycosyltransferase, partial [Chloroflexota bacterium]|nr:WecB/TagA/CpsF family glycosyltransferase [Chloroflexota bacterium]
PPFRKLTHEEDQEKIEMINAANPDVVWVGLSSPKQEYWMAEHLGRINAPVMIGVGAAFDFLSGNKPQAPRWIQRSGFEWLFRLATEPKRLWPRYRQYPAFVFLVLLQMLGLKEFPSE